MSPSAFASSSKSLSCARIRRQVGHGRGRGAVARSHRCACAPQACGRAASTPRTTSCSRWKPTHAFDARAIHDRTIVVRRTRPGERLRPSTTSIAPSTPTRSSSRTHRADRDRGRHGRGRLGSRRHDGRHRRVSHLRPVSIRRTGRRARSGRANSRFRGQDVPTARVGADRVAALIVAWSGGSVLRGAWTPIPEPRRRVAFRPPASTASSATRTPDDQRALLARGSTEPAPATPMVVASGTEPLVVDPTTEALVTSSLHGRHRHRADVAGDRPRGRIRCRPSRAETLMPAYRPSPLESGMPSAGARRSRPLESSRTPSSRLDRSRISLARRRCGAPGEASGGAVVSVRNPLSRQHSVCGSTARQPARRPRDERTPGRRASPSSRSARDTRPPEARTSGGASVLLAGRPTRRRPCPAAGRPRRREGGRRAHRGAPRTQVRLLHRRSPRTPFHPAEPPSSGARRRAGKARPTGYVTGPGDLAISGHVAELQPSVAETWELRAPRILVAELAIAGLSAGRSPGRRRPSRASRPWTATSPSSSPRR
jgi:hypothetical protein